MVLRKAGLGKKESQKSLENYFQLNLSQPLRLAVTDAKQKKSISLFSIQYRLQVNAAEEVLKAYISLSI